MDLAEQAKDIISGGNFALLDNNKGEGAKISYLFYDPIAYSTALLPQEVDGKINEIEGYVRDGFHAVGYFSYELGYALNQRLKARLPGKRELPLFYLGIYRQRMEMRDDDVERVFHELSIDRDVFIKNCSLNMSKEQYVEQLARVKKHIYDGDTYQVNYTLKYKFMHDGSPLKLYSELRRRQRVEYGCYLDFPDLRVLSRSPELFVRKVGDSIHTKPMKGTCKRGDTPEQDKANFEFLSSDEKSRAENVMIVDLLRNDLSRISERGSVRTSGLFEVQTYETLHQMVSTVSGKIDADMPLSKILKEIYPCGSITGAPKVRTMEIINEVEKEPRGVYTGAIGYISPDKAICLNVPIRTLVLWPDGSGEMGVGSGVVHDSDADAEYEECCLKGTFFTKGFADFHLIESLLFDGSYPLLDWHLQRLTRSAQELGFGVNLQALKADLLARAASLQGRHKVRLMLEKSGEHRIECISIEAADDQPKRIIISSEAVHSNSWSLRYKLSQRTRYRKAHEFYSRLGYYDVVFFNENSEITEGSFNNIFIREGDRWYTPPIECGLLPGVQRQWLLDSGHVDATEKRLVMDDLYRADEIFLTNAVRGVVKVELATTPNEASCSA